MRTFRLLLSVCSMTAIAVGGLVACGDDDTGSASSSSGSTTSSSSSGATSSSSSGNGSSSSSGSPEAGPLKPTANAKTTPKVYVGQITTFDGSESVGANLTYAWTITAPAGSAITTASLQGATTAKPTFVPDKAGSYAATLTVSSTGLTATANVTVEVFEAPLFFFSNEPNESNGQLHRAQLRRTTNVGDGGAGVAVACFRQDAGADLGSENATSIKATYGAVVWSDVWEAPAGSPSRAVYKYKTTPGEDVKLWASTSNDLCDPATEPPTGTSPKAIDSVPIADVSDFSFELPRFSPNGNRVVYIRNSKSEGYRIASVGFDGTALHKIAYRETDADGGQDAGGGRYTNISPGPRPGWIDDNTVTWLTSNVDTGSWQVLKAADTDGASPTLVMSCTGATNQLPSGFAVLPNGDVIVSQRNADPDANTVASNLHVYTPGADKKCGTPKDITKIVSTGGGSLVQSFALSPDKTRVAYYVGRDDGTASVFVTNVDGSGTPQSLGIATDPYQGPRWIAGGSQVTWGLDATKVADGGTEGSALVIASAASDAGPRVAVVGDNTRTNYAINNSTCSFGYGIGSAMSGFGFLGLLGLGITRRRNKKQS